MTPKQLRALRPYRDLACDFDYLYVIGRLPAQTPLPPALKTLVVGDGFTLFRIVAPPQRSYTPPRLDRGLERAEERDVGELVRPHLATNRRRCGCGCVVRVSISSRSVAI